jgi:transcriptional regulator with XRE-family HTH domain
MPKEMGYDMSTIQALIDKMRLRRYEKKMSQADLAKATGVSRNYISQIERGLVDHVSFFVLAKICLTLGLVLTLDAIPYETYWKAANVDKAREGSEKTVVFSVYQYTCMECGHVGMLSEPVGQVRCAGCNKTICLVPKFAE